MHGKVAHVMEPEQVMVHQPLDEVEAPPAEQHLPSRTVRGGVTPARPSACSHRTPVSVTTSIAAWNQPSQRMFQAMASIDSGGTTAEPMLCHCAI